MLGAEGEGFKIAMYSLDKGRVSVATGSGSSRAVSMRAANLAIQVFGGYGYVDEYPVQKFMTPQVPLACSQPTR